jgi:hypothetical protein
VTFAANYDEYTAVRALARIVVASESELPAFVCGRRALLLQSLPLEENRAESYGDPGTAVSPPPSRSRPSSWRRPHAPIAYPCGDPPPLRSRTNDGCVSQPVAKSSAECRARLDAYWRDGRARNGDG